ncbi:hypothetical protein M9978_06680 [Sphingomonas sp. MG17]|jgi:hypothetical protein|uniref:DUF3617 family protein n=1 Tax=Sphingomonas tagetis TaxID=2949092 RepID=A0A9X2HHP6_9SPHN|nr:hypothetical protein [Sphingomonas tagetis]MCP3730112.1 hypothetical protein [Sphingomonas tagetis]
MSRIGSILTAVVMMATGFSAAAQSGGLAALGKIERGEWSLRAPDGSTRSICITDPQMLLQLRHRGVACQRFVVENGTMGGRVTYSCPGVGNGDTRITVETPRLIRLETQGISRGLPFTEEYEGRRTGACASASASR